MELARREPTLAEAGLMLITFLVSLNQAVKTMPHITETTKNQGQTDLTTNSALQMTISPYYLPVSQSFD